MKKQAIGVYSNVSLKNLVGQAPISLGPTDSRNCAVFLIIVIVIYLLY